MKTLLFRFTWAPSLIKSEIELEYLFYDDNTYYRTFVAINKQDYVGTWRWDEQLEVVLTLEYMRRDRDFESVDAQATAVYKQMIAETVCQ